ncbi:hypothetical protein [Hufsiella ginkgonis]|uniref:SIR2-like domain-containing protein n=1 Tax=Hufsiella ginkgonis TaxID=2695274 RepID=A0A7K1XUB0_9SPHI|nr:hypothetical protein [Hufsiella ginkgonis]MXV14349.1 hypothetical protein [Hufsiella ginkgonis]
MNKIPESLVEAITEAHRPAPTRNLSFLLGSGFSRGDNMPLVRDINERLSNLKETDFYLYQEMTAGFYKDDYRDPNAKMTLRDRCFAEEFVRFYVANSCAGKTENFNYETFFDYFIEFLYEKQHQDEVNRFCEEYKGKNKLRGHFDNALNLLTRFLNIFNQLVASLLTRVKYYENISYTGGYPSYEHFSRIMYDILKDNIVNVHSLNHDMLFDHIGNSTSGIFEHFSDGFTEMNSPFFGKIQQNLKIDGKDFFKSYKVRLKHYTNTYKGRLRFFKLHGSVDIFPLYLEGSEEPITIKTDYGVGDIYKEQINSSTGQSEYIYPFSNKFPSYLTGTTQKIKRYKDPFFSTLFDHFQDNLNLSDKLIVIGYGFQDQGINDILDASYLKHGKLILVVDVNKPDSDLIRKYPDQFVFAETGIGETHYEVYHHFLKN